MADYFLDDASNGTNDGASWATCYNTWAQVNAAGILTAANRLFVGADANITDPGAALTITGPTSGAPAPIISSTVGSGTTVSYSVGTGTQVNTSSGAFAINFDGCFALYGLRVVSGADLNLASDGNELSSTFNCDLAVGANGRLHLNQNNSRWTSTKDKVNLTADGTTNRSGDVIVAAATARVEIQGMTFTNAAYRTGVIFNVVGRLQVSGSDFSGFTNATACEFVSNGFATFNNCLTAATWTLHPAISGQILAVSATNTGPADAPTYAYLADL
jgi:hypothetical protein